LLVALVEQELQLMNTAIQPTMVPAGAHGMLLYLLLLRL
jgi:hypothetical protein